MWAAGAALCLSGCATLPSRTAGALPSNSGSSHVLKGVEPVGQAAYRCGPAALESVFRYWGRDLAAEPIGASLLARGERGVLNFALSQYARGQGFWSQIHQGDLGSLRRWIRDGTPPIVLLKTGPLGLPLYHFVVVRGFDDQRGIVYANTGRPQTQAIPYGPFQKRWKAAHGWLLILCPPEKVDWALTQSQTLDLALLFEHTGKAEPAQQRYREALERTPDSMPIRFNLANTCYRMGQRREAKLLYQSLILEEPAEPAYSNNLAWAFLEEGNPRESIRVGEAALRRGTERRYDLLDTLGLAYFRAGHHGKARFYLSEALSRVPPEKGEAARLIREHLEQCGQLPPEA